MILVSNMIVEVAVASYLRVGLKFKFTDRSDEPHRRRSTGRQTDKQMGKQTSKIFQGHWSKELRYRSDNKLWITITLT